MIPAERKTRIVLSVLAGDVSIAEAALDPANANRYTFAANDPINNADPLGLIIAEAKVGACAIICAGVSFGKDNKGHFGIQASGGNRPKVRSRNWSRNV